MILSWPFRLLPGVLLLTPVLALAQDDAAEVARKAQETQIARQQQAIRGRSTTDTNSFLQRPTYRNVPMNSAGELRFRLFEFQQAIPKFRNATDEYRRAIGLKENLGKPLKDIASQTSVMLRYLKVAKIKHPEMDPLEFKDYKQDELVWETLSSAERIATFVDLAVAVERQEVVSLKMLEFMYKLNGELLRLKWLASRSLR